MSVLSDIIERLRTLVFRRREERELAEELRFHVEMETELGVRRGLSENEARRKSLIALGGVEQTKETVRDARGTQFVEQSINDFKYAVRALAKSPGFSLVAILTLAIGIGGTTAVFSAVDAVMLQPLPYAEPGQLVRLYQGSIGRVEHGYVTPVHYLEYRTRMSSLEDVAAIDDYAPVGADIGGSDHPERIRLLPVSAAYWKVLRAPPMLGRGFTAAEEEGASVVVVSHAMWEREFASSVSAIGKPFIMSGKSFTVVGVMAESFADPLADHVDAWIPVNVAPGRDVSNSDNHYLTVIARMRSGYTVARAQLELDKLDLQLAAQYKNASESRANLAPLKEDIVAPATRSLTLMLGAVGLVLLIVCVNIANLLLVRGSERTREFAVRAALGGERARLVRQLLIESLTLAIAGVLLGLVVARAAMSAIVLLGASSIPRLTSLTLEPRLLLFSVTIASLSAIGFGLAPAFRMTRAQPSDVLRSQARSTTGGRAQGRLREALVVSQVALAFVLLVGAGLLVASFQRLRQLDLGVQTAGVLTFELQLPSARYDSTGRARFYENFAAKVMQLPGVRAAGGTSRLPGTGQFNRWGTSALSGPLNGTKQARVQPTPEQRMVSGEYFQALNIPIIEGRVFDQRDDATATRKYVVSQSFARAGFPNVSAIGQRISAGGRVGEIIGVVGDVSVTPEGETHPYVYHSHQQMAAREWMLSQVIQTNGDATTLIPAVRRLLTELDPQLVMFNPGTLSEAIGRGEATRLFVMRILATFALVALGLAALGLFGVLSYGVKLRTKEFGIRMALGADRSAIRAVVMRRGLFVTSIGVVAGALGALALSRVMATLVFRVSPLDVRVMGVAAVFMALVALVAAYLPAYRATIVDPREALQAD